MSIRRLVGLVFAGVVLVAPAVSGSAETARQILDRRKALEDGAQHWDDRHQRMKLTIHDRQGGERVRDLELWEKKYPNDTTKSLAVFHAPAEVKGTAFLAFTYTGKRADQWLYLPELKRVRQITASARKEKFVGTDLTYHDLDLVQEMTGWTEDDARSSLRGAEAVDGVQTWAIELVPKREDILYKRIVIWLGQDDLVPRRLEFYDEGEEPRRRITQSDIRMHGTVPFAGNVKAETPPQGSTTDIVVSDVQFNKGLADDIFTQRQLELGAPGGDGGQTARAILDRWKGQLGQGAP
jgi:outer membrane lipoprotein-sorting protein